MLSTPDIIDQYPDLETLIEFKNFGGTRSFHGEIQTIQCYEDNSFVKKELSKMSDSGVLVIDGNASKNCALLGRSIGSDGQRQWMVRNHHKWFGKRH